LRKGESLHDLNTTRASEREIKRERSLGRERGANERERQARAKKGKRKRVMLPTE